MMKIIDTMDDLLQDMTPFTQRCLTFACTHPDKLIPVYPEMQNTPKEAEEEARRLVEQLRNIVLDGECAMPAFHICHVERNQIWCEFSLNHDFVQLLVKFHS